MALTPEQYLEQLLALQPPGSALPRDPDSTWGRLLQAEADELARVDRRADDLVVESDPRTSAELLPDWERVCGLPDGCASAANTLAERRAAVHSKLVDQGGQSRAYFIGLAKALGFDVTIEEHRPFTCITACDQPIYDETWCHTWTMRAPETTVREFTCASSCTDPLASWGNELLECVIRQRKPAHTLALFAYGG